MPVIILFALTLLLLGCARDEPDQMRSASSSNRPHIRVDSPTYAQASQELPQSDPAAEAALAQTRKAIAEAGGSLDYQDILNNFGIGMGRVDANLNPQIADGARALAVTSYRIREGLHITIEERLMDGRGAAIVRVFLSNHPAGITHRY